MTISPTPRHRSFRLTVPAAAEFVATARLFISGVATAIGDEDVTDDLKLAVSELVTAIVTHGSEQGEVTVTATVDDAELVVEVTPWPGEMAHEDFGPLDIVEALFPGTASTDGMVRVPVDLSER